MEGAPLPPLAHSPGVLPLTAQPLHVGGTEQDRTGGKHPNRAGIHPAQLLSLAQPGLRH